MQDPNSNEQSCCKINNLAAETEETGCPWWIKSPEHNNCLWEYIREKSGPDGSMPELVQTEIAELLGWSNTKTHFMLKQAMEELVTALKENQANQLLGSNPDYLVDIYTYDIELATKPSDDEE